MILDLLTLLASLTASVAVARRSIRDMTGEVISRWATATVIGLGTFVAIGGVLVLWKGGVGDPWNAARITPAIALHEGQKPYWPMNSGPVLSTVVGPVAFLAYWPVGLLPTTSPTTLILAGSGLNLLVLALLIRWLLRALRPELLTGCVVALLGTHLALHYPALRSSLFGIHADAPALLLATFGLLALILQMGLSARSRHLLAGVVVSLAIWAKQSIVPAAAGLLVVEAIRHGPRSALKLALAIILTGTALSLLLIEWLGFAELSDNMLKVPSRHPWSKIDPISGVIDGSRLAESLLDRLKMLAAGAVHLIRSYWPLVLATGGAVCLELSRPAADLRRRTWWAFPVLALLLMPTAVAGRLKVGGDVNHESFFLFFLLLALIAWVCETGLQTQLHKWLALAALLLFSGINLPQLRGLRGWGEAWKNQNEVVYEFLRKHPGEIYFPWNPLSSFLAERRLYHFDYGVFDRNLGQSEVTPEHLQQAIPSRQPLIASTYAHHDYILRRYFPTYVPYPARADLPEWRIYGPPPASSSPGGVNP
jgi:hypothetical protein